MEEEIFCINHPRTATLVRCSNCESPICPKCMVLTPVGQKCLSCGKVEFKAAAGGGARRYAAGGAGLLTAAVLEVAIFSLGLGILAFVAPLIVGYLTGLVVRKVAGGGFGSTAAIATGCGMAMGFLLLGAPLRFLLGFGFLFQAAIAAYVAWYRANH